MSGSLKRVVGGSGPCMAHLSVLGHGVDVSLILEFLPTHPKPGYTEDSA